MDRRSFYRGRGVMLSSKALAALAPMQTKNGDAPLTGKADHSLRIEPLIWRLARA